MTYKDKKRKTDHHVIGMADSMPQKKRRSVKLSTRRVASDNATSMAKAFQAFSNSCALLLSLIFSLVIFTCSLLSKWLLFNV